MIGDAQKLPQPAEIPADLALALFAAAAVSARAAARLGAKTGTLAPRRRIGITLRPGSATPLWNELLKQARPHLHKRGEKVKVARYLGLPRQRVHEFFKARSACPDAERTLLLLCWVAHRRQGHEF